MNNLLKKCSIVLVSMIGVLLFQPIAEANATPKNDVKIQSKLSQTILYEDNNKIVIALVDDNQKQAYEKEILNNPNFKQQELNNVNLDMRYLPPGRIIAQRFMYKGDISCVRLTEIENSTEYQKAYIIIERI